MQNFQLYPKPNSVTNQSFKPTIDGQLDLLKSAELNQWLTLWSRFEERVVELTSIHRIDRIHSQLLLSGIQLIRLELQLKMAVQEDQVEVLPNLVFLPWKSNQEEYFNYISVEIEVAKNVVHQCSQTKLLSKMEGSMLLIGLRLLKVELDESRSTQYFSI